LFERFSDQTECLFFFFFSNRIIQQQMQQQKLHMNPNSMRNSAAFPSALNRLASTGSANKSSVIAGQSSSAASAVNSRSANSLLRFSVEALAGNGSSDCSPNGLSSQLSAAAAGSADAALSASKLELNDLGLMGMAARLGYSGYFGGLAGFPALSQLNQAFGNIGALVGSGNASSIGLGSSGANLHHLQPSSSASSGHVMSDDDDDLLDDDDDRLEENVSITSWDEEPAADSDDELPVVGKSGRKAIGVKKRRTATTRSNKLISSASTRPDARNRSQKLNKSHRNSPIDTEPMEEDEDGDDEDEDVVHPNRRLRDEQDTVDEDEDDDLDEDDEDDDDDDMRRINRTDDNINIMDDCAESGRALSQIQSD
jgi:hypothetical protein